MSADVLHQIETLIATGEEILTLREQACRTWVGRLLWKLGHARIDHRQPAGLLEGDINELIARAHGSLRARLIRLRDIQRAVSDTPPVFGRRA